MSETVKYSLAHKSIYSNSVNNYVTPQRYDLAYAVTMMMSLNSDLGERDTYWTILPVVTVNEVTL